MMRYAQINADGICYSDSRLSAAVDSPSMVPIADDAESPVGLRWTGSAWEAVEPPPQPEIVITNVQTDNPAAIIQPGDVTVPVGTAVTVTAELRGPDGAVLPVDAAFRMPFTARDGRERILLAQFAQGVASIGTTVSESGCWQISEATINRDLPAEQHMRFAGLSIYAVQ